jgi:hypothetical protein
MNRDSEMSQDSDHDADHHRDHDQNHHGNREPDRIRSIVKEPIPRRKISDAQVCAAVETIAYYAVQQAEAKTTHHVHMLPFDNLTQQQRRASISLMIWLALDVTAGDKNIWLDELIENVLAEDNWQDLILDRIPADERPTIIKLPAIGARPVEQ